jgi:hypothetical protein
LVKEIKGEKAMKSTKTLEFKFERTIPAPPGKVFDGSLNPEIPGTPWHEADKLILNPKVGGFFYQGWRGSANIPIPAKPDLPISYNIGPSQPVLAIRFNPETKQRSLDTF